jgi:AcrR family transcriptional regulator
MGVNSPVARWNNVLQTNAELHCIKRNAVLRIATDIIRRRGFHNMSLDDIASALEVSKGTLYNYVKDKQEILFECHQVALDISDKAFEFADDHGTSGFARLRLMLKAYMLWLNGVVGGGGVVTEVSALRPSDRKKVIARRDQVEAMIVRYFEQGFADGTIRPTNPKLATYTLLGAVNGVQLWYSPAGPLSLEVIASEMLDLLLSGLRTAADNGYVDIVIPPLDPPETATFLDVVTPPRLKPLVKPQ